MHCFGLEAELGEDIEAVVEEEEIDFSCLWQVLAHNFPLHLTELIVDPFPLHLTRFIIYPVSGDLLIPRCFGILTVLSGFHLNDFEFSGFHFIPSIKTGCL